MKIVFRAILTKCRVCFWCNFITCKVLIWKSFISLRFLQREAVRYVKFNWCIRYASRDTTILGAHNRIISKLPIMSLLCFLGKLYAECLQKDAVKYLNQRWTIPSDGFVLAVASQILGKQCRYGLAWADMLKRAELPINDEALMHPDIYADALITSKGVRVY